MKDVLCGGMLLTYWRQSAQPVDTGLRFKKVGADKLACPCCGCVTYAEGGLRCKPCAPESDADTSCRIPLDTPSIPNIWSVPMVHHKPVRRKFFDLKPAELSELRRLDDYIRYLRREAVKPPRLHASVYGGSTDD